MFWVFGFLNVHQEILCDWETAAEEGEEEKYFGHLTPCSRICLFVCLLQQCNTDWPQLNLIALFKKLLLHIWHVLLISFVSWEDLSIKPVVLDGVAVSVFEVILIEFDKCWIIIRIRSNPNDNMIICPVWLSCLPDNLRWTQEFQWVLTNIPLLIMLCFL